MRGRAPGKRETLMEGVKIGCGSDGRLLFHCPGCNEGHWFQVAPLGPPTWTWNGSLTSPTVRNSILNLSGHYAAGKPNGKCWCTYNAEMDAAGKERAPFECSVCHLFITDGQIQFLDDCTHALSGKTVPMEEF